MLFWFLYFRPKSFDVFVGMFLCHTLPGVDRIFCCCFGMSCFVCIVLPCVDISLIAFFSSELSGLFPQVVLLFFTWCLFHSVPTYSRIFCFTIWACFCRFFFCISSWISHPGFDCFVVLFEGIPIFSQNNFAPTCSTMGVGRQSKRVCFGAKPDKGFLDKKI